MSLTNEQILQELKEAMTANGNTKKQVNEALTHAMTAIQNMDKRTAEAYDQGLQEAWGLAKRIGGSVNNGGYDYNVLSAIFHSSSVVVIFDNHTYDQANNKIKTYEKKKEEKELEKSQEPIRGDEIIVKGPYDTFHAIFISEIQDVYWVIRQDINNPLKIHKSNGWQLTKTGRHIELFGEGD